MKPLRSSDAAPGGYDVIIDFLWGAPAPHAINHANVGARYVQVGSSAGPVSAITASAIRNKLLTLVGLGTVGTPAEVRRSAYAELMRHALDGKLTLDLERTRLDDIGETWRLLKAGPRRKLVVEPLPGRTTGLAVPAHTAGSPESSDDPSPPRGRGWRGPHR